MAFCVFVCPLSGQIRSDDWPQFLGPERTGISQETGLISTFPADGPRVAWRSPVGTGMSGIAVVDKVALTLFQTNDAQYCVAVNTADGAKKWQTRIAPSFRNSMGDGPRTTPTVVNGTAYVFSGEGVLAAISVENGQLLWSVDAPKQLNGRPAEYGMASSPLVIDDTVIVQTGAKTGTLAAFATETGDLKWTAGSGAAGYSSAIIATLSGRPQIVALAGSQVLGVNPDDGGVLWRFPYVTDFHCNTATPVALSDSSVFVSAAENHGSTILNVKSSDDRFTVTPAWESLGKDSVLRAEWQTPVVFDGHLYALDNLGSAGPITNLVCVRLADGQQVWNRKRFGKSNLTLADGKLFLSSMKGELIIVTATPSAFEETARATVLRTTRQAPVIADGRLYLRDDREIVCVDIRNGD